MLLAIKYEVFTFPGAFSRYCSFHSMYNWVYSISDSFFGRLPLVTAWVLWKLLAHIYIYTKSPHPVLPRFKTLAHASKTRSSNKHIVIMQTCWVSYPADTHEDCLSPGHCHAQASLAACSKLRLNKLLDILRLSLSPQPRLNRQRIVMRRKLPARV